MDFEVQHLKSAEGKLIGRWVYLKTKDSQGFIFTPVKIVKTDFYNHKVSIQLSKDHVELVDFSDLQSIHFASERDFLSFNNDIERQKLEWNKTDKDKPNATPANERCKWIYNNFKSWLLPDEWNVLINKYNFNFTYDDFYTDFIAKVVKNNDKNKKYMVEAK